VPDAPLARLALHTLARVVETGADGTPGAVRLEAIGTVHATHGTLAPHQGLLCLLLLLLTLIIVHLFLFPLKIIRVIVSNLGHKK
jgi:hypothetical protein